MKFCINFHYKSKYSYCFKNKQIQIVTFIYTPTMMHCDSYCVKLWAGHCLVLHNAGPAIGEMS